MATRIAPEFGSAKTPGFPARGIELAGLVVLVLTLLTGLVFGQLASVVSSNPASLAMTTSGATDRVRAFYDGMNRYLATGDDAFLDLLAPGYQDHQALDAGTGSSAALLARLDTMRQHASQPHFVIEQLTEFGNLVEVRLSAPQPATLDVAGLTATFDFPPTIRELVQLQRGAIVARWSQDGLIPLTDYTLDAPVLINAGDAVLFSISRVTLEAGSNFELPGDAPFGLLVQQGSVSLLAGATSQRLTGGNDRWIEPAGHTRITNLEPTPTVFWIVMVGIIRANYAGIDGMPSSPNQPGVTVEQLVRTMPYVWPSKPGQLRLRVALVTLPPGTRLIAGHPAMGEALAMVDGALDTTVYQGLARHRGPNKQNSPVDDRASIIGGEGIVALHDATAAYRVAGSTPATLFVITAVPVPASMSSQQSPIG